MSAPWHSRTRGSHALEWITPWPTEPVRFTGVTDVVIPAMRSWPDHMLRRWYSTHRQAWRHHATRRTGFRVVTADATIQEAPGYPWP